MATGHVEESADIGAPLQGGVLEMIATGAPLAAVLDTLCRAIDERSGLMSAVFLVDDDGKRLTQIAGPHLPDVWREATHSLPLTPTTTSCGAAVSRSEQVIATDVASDPLFEGFRELASATGIAAVWSTPFYAKDHRVLGTFAVLSPSPGRPSEENLQLVMRATHLASIATQRHLAEAAVRESEERFRLIAENIGEVFWVRDLVREQVTFVSPMYEEVFGRSRASLYANPRSFLDAIHKDDRARIETAASRQRAGMPTDERYRVIRPDGSLVWIRDRAFPVAAHAGRITRVVGVAEEITDAQRQLEDIRLGEEALRSSNERSQSGFAKPSRSWWRNPPATLRYAVAVVSVTAAVIIARWLESHLVSAPVSLFLGAIMFSAWFGGIKPGLLAVAISLFAFVTYFVNPINSLAVNIQELPRILVFVVSALLVVMLAGSQKQTTESLRSARDDLGRTVLELRRLNEAMQAENAERNRAEEALRRSEGLLRVVLDVLPVGVGVLDLSGNIILKNPASERIWNRVISSGQDRYTESKAWWHATGQKLAPQDWTSARALIAGESFVNELVDIEAFDGVRKVIQNSAVPIRDGNDRVTGAVIVIEDVSARLAAERELSDSYHQMRTLTGRLMRAQDDERRRIAQMLHETTAQDLAALKMLLARLNRTSHHLNDDERSALIESITLAEQSMSAVRTLSYVLHPPFLDETGLLSALRWYATGFAERSGIHVDLDLPEAIERLPLETETALFRIVQESLTNIHRHAGSEAARIQLRADAETLELAIEDRGHGIPAETLKQIIRGRGLVGVGITGMYERIEQLGGRLEITSDNHGTTVRARLPLATDTG